MKIKTANIPDDVLSVLKRSTLGENCLNPPFTGGQDIKHTLHAKSLLRDGGRLVGLCANGAKQAKAIRPLCCDWEELPEGAFKDSGTMSKQCLFVIQN